MILFLGFPPRMTRMRMYWWMVPFQCMVRSLLRRQTGVVLSTLTDLRAGCETPLGKWIRLLFQCGVLVQRGEAPAPSPGRVYERVAWMLVKEWVGGWVPLDFYADLWSPAVNFPLAVGSSCDVDCASFTRLDVE